MIGIYVWSVSEDDRLSVHTPNGAHHMISRQGSKLSYGSNESSGSSNSINKVVSLCWRRYFPVH